MSVYDCMEKDDSPMAEIVKFVRRDGVYLVYDRDFIRLFARCSDFPELKMVTALLANKTDGSLIIRADLHMLESELNEAIPGLDDND